MLMIMFTFLQPYLLKLILSFTYFWENVCLLLQMNCNCGMHNQQNPFFPAGTIIPSQDLKPHKTWVQSFFKEAVEKWCAPFESWVDRIYALTRYFQNSMFFLSKFKRISMKWSIMDMPQPRPCQISSPLKMACIYIYKGTITTITRITKENKKKN